MQDHYKCKKVARQCCVSFQWRFCISCPISDNRTININSCEINTVLKMCWSCPFSFPDNECCCMTHLFEAEGALEHTQELPWKPCFTWKQRQEEMKCAWGSPTSLGSVYNSFKLDQIKRTREDKGLSQRSTWDKIKVMLLSDCLRPKGR